MNHPWNQPWKATLKALEEETAFSPAFPRF